jgi:outer membrane protease
MIVFGLAGAAWADEAPAADAPASAPTTKFEIGTRLWYSTGTSEFDLFDPPGRVSALHYEDQQAVSAELFARADSPQGVFVKAVGAFGGVFDGTLIDEDFPPFVVPYSKTTSTLDGELDFFSIDVGYNVIDDDGLRIGAFAGWGYWHEHFDAKGCRQIGSNPGICGLFPIPTNVTVISEDNKYRSLRLGLAGDGRLSDRLSWAAEAAYLITDHENLDVHHFTFGPAPAEGDGNGFQLEAALLYQMTPAFNLGLGARWWQMNTDVVIPSFGNQPETYDVGRQGIFVQGGLRLN